MMRILARTAAWLAGLTGWRRWAVAAVLGALAVLAFAPTWVLPVLPVAFTALVWMIDGAARGPRPVRAGLALGWWFGFGYFVAGLYWISNALLVDAADFGWLVPFAVTGLSAYFAIYPALAVLAAARARPGWPRVLALAGAWGLAEYLRGTLLTGFPWNLAGSALAALPALMQGAALVGAYGLSLVVVAVAAAPATLVPADGETEPVARARRLAPTLVAVLAFACLWVGGALRLAGAPALGAVSKRAPSLRIVQGDIAQRMKWHPAEARKTFETYLRLSRAPGLGGVARAPDAVIWPETAVPYVFDGDPGFLRALAQAAPPDGVLITGVVRRTPTEEQLRARREAQQHTPGAPSRAAAPVTRIWNSVIAVTARGRLEARYDKHHLVPFGEYVPLRDWNPLPKLTQGRMDFSAGSGPATLTVPGLPPFSPLVCYEIIFPGAVTAPGLPRPRWLLNVTNDAWFGDSSGPHQHFAAARLRAVEEGLPLVRAANTGISALVDPYGRVVAELPLGTRGTLDVALPAPIPGTTPFALWGNRPFLALAGLLLALGLLVRGTRKQG